MPWCEECEAVVEDDALTEELECPDCGSVLAEEVRKPVPWYFKFMMFASVIYLGYRAYQGVTWVVHHV
ncbi:MAG: hypothetical protein ACRDWE_09200 [Acidimicrobiales bacterium]